MADPKISSMLNASETKIYESRFNSMISTKKKGDKTKEEAEDASDFGKVSVNKIGAATGLPTKISNPFDDDAPDFAGKTLHVVGTGIPLIDLHLYPTEDKSKRGFKPGIHLFTGNANTTKTTTLNRIMVNTINSEGGLDSGYVYYFDKVGNWDRDYFRNGMCGKVLDENRLKTGHFKYQRVSTFKDLAANLEDIMATWHNVLINKVMEYNSQVKKTERIALNSMYLPRDVCPVVIVVDDFDALFSENSAGKDFAEEAPAESNRDVHRLFQQILPKLNYLGIPFFIANHFRDQIGSFGPIKVRNPALWKSMQGYATNAFDFSKAPGRMKMVDDKKVLIDESVSIKLRKIKQEHSFISPIRFVPGRGHDLFDSTLRALRKAGFTILKVKGEDRVSVIDSVTFVEHNKLGQRMPKPIRMVLEQRGMLGGTFSMKDIAKYMKQDTEFAKLLYNSFMKSIGRLEIISESKTSDHRAGDVDGPAAPATSESIDIPIQATEQSEDAAEESLDDKLERQERDSGREAEENPFEDEDSETDIDSDFEEEIVED